MFCSCPILIEEKAEQQTHKYRAGSTQINNAVTGSVRLTGQQKRKIRQGINFAPALSAKRDTALQMEIIDTAFCVHKPVRR